MTSLLPLPLGSLFPLLFLLFSPFALLLTLPLTFLNVNCGLKANQVALTLSSLLSYSVLPLILASLAVTSFNNTMKQPCIGLKRSLHTLSPINLLIVCLFLWFLLVTTTSRWHAICVPLEVVHVSMRVGLSWIPLLLCYTWSFTFPWPFSQFVVTSSNIFFMFNIHLTCAGDFFSLFGVPVHMSNSDLFIAYVMLLNLLVS